MTMLSEHTEADTQERILVVAERLFREIGYQKTTVADIAKLLRMSPANVYRFFPSKDAIRQAEKQAGHRRAALPQRHRFRPVPSRRGSF